MSNNAGNTLIALIGGAAIGLDFIYLLRQKEIKLELKLVMVIGGQS
jgi:hypothetical protein